MNIARAGFRLFFDVATPIINVGSPLGWIWILTILAAITWAADFSLYQSGWFIVE